MPSSPSSSAASVDAPQPPPEALHPPYPPPALTSPLRHRRCTPPTTPEDSPVPDARLYMPPSEPLVSGLQSMPPPARLISGLRDELGYAFQPPPPPLLWASELMGWEDRPSSSTASSSFFPDTAVRYRPLLEQTGSRWLRPRRFRSQSHLPPLSSEARPYGLNAAMPVPQHEPAADTAEVNKVAANVSELGVSEESTEERGKTAATFECNICFEMASEPVVTSCGHLFCWPCLYQWLNVYSNHKECPVCKGEVTEANITPIYGRGNSDGEKAVEDGKPQGPRIPPRPHGNRVESFRQQFHHMRPISRRLSEAHGILSSWRRLLDQQIMNSASRFEGSSESAVQEINDTAQRATCLSRIAVATRMRGRQMQREVERRPDGSSTASDTGLMNNVSELRRGSTPRVSNSFELLEHLAYIGIANTERLASAMSDLGRMASPSQYGGSASSSNPQNNEPAVDGINVAGAPSADQACNSSTVAVVHGDAGISGSAGEPSNAGSWRSLLMRGRNNALGSLDEDGEGFQRNKRRRMN